MKSFCPVKTDVKFYSKNGSTTSDCIAITFIVPTTGNPVNVNGYEIPAGGSFAIELSQGYIDASRYEFFFAPGVGTNQLTIVRVIPVNDYKNE